jgi:hypothetical protein
MYPYEFEPKRLGINHREIFVAMPFDPTYDDVFEVLIKQATEEANKRLDYGEGLSLYPYRTKDDIRTTSGWINILEHLLTAQIVMGVLTSDNPNVFYELGIAHATQPLTRQILIASKGYKPKFNTKDLIYYEYDDNSLDSSVEPLATKIEDAIKTYSIEHEKIVHQARMKIGPSEFEIMRDLGKVSHFAFDISDEGLLELEKRLGVSSVERRIKGITNLCHQGLLALNTKAERDDESGKVSIEFSYWWTSLGNDVLHLLKSINEETLTNRKSKLPPFVD